MGADIIVCVEQLVDDQWTNIDLWERMPDCSFSHNACYTAQSYALFGVLADVREPDVDAYIERRGFPVNACPVTHNLYVKDDDAHSPTYLALQEVYEAAQYANKMCNDAAVKLAYEIRRTYVHARTALNKFIEQVVSHILRINPSDASLLGSADFERRAAARSKYRVVIWFEC